MMIGTVRWLPEETQAQLGIDVHSLWSHADTQVYAQCERCEEIFLRSRRLLGLRHHCPEQLTRSDGSIARWCPGCGAYRDLGLFNGGDELDGRHLCCSHCQHDHWKAAVSYKPLHHPGEVGVASPVRLECKLLHPDAKLPHRSRTTDAGLDVATIDDGVIPPHGGLNFHTGLIITAPPGFYITVDGRSRLWSNKVIPFRGTIDGTYTDELKVAMINFGDSPYQVHRGDRIAQLVLHRIIHADLQLVAEFSPLYNQRGTAGFGSSGR